MNLTRFAVNNQPLMGLMMIILIAGGLFVFSSYPSQEDPEFIIREAVVTTRFPGMSPERVEDLITRRIEEKLREIPETKHIESSSKTGVSIIHFKVHDKYFDMDRIWTDLRNKIDDMRSDLPEGTKGPFINTDFGLVSVATIAITGDGFSMAELRQVAKDARIFLYPTKGVRRIDLYGVQEERIFLEVASSRMVQLGITPTQVFESLQNQNIILPGGTVEILGQNIVVEPSGNFESLEQLKSVPIEIPNSDQVFYVRDIMNVRRGYIDPPEKPAFYNGEPAVMLAVSMIPGTNIVEFGNRIKHKVREFETSLPIGYNLRFATFQPEIVDTSIADFTNNLYQTLAVVLFVVVIFLGIRTGLIVGGFVPFVMLAGLIIMRSQDILLQRISIAAMIIALGMLVDNGIVIAESISNSLKIGMDRKDAAIQAGSELQLPLLTSSLTTILAFMPIITTDHAVGEFCLSLGQVIIIVLLGSWLLALTFVPLLCVWFMKAETNSTEKNRDLYSGRFYQAYRWMLSFVLRVRIPFLSLMIVAFAGGVYAFQFVPKILMPDNERPEFTVYFDLPAGATIRQTVDTMTRFSKWLRDKRINPEVVDFMSYAGAGGPRFFLAVSPIDPDPHHGFMLVRLKNINDLEKVMERVKSHLSNYPELRPRVKKFFFGPTEPGLIKIRVSGPDAETLFGLSRRIRDAFHDIQGTRSIKDDWENKVPKLVVRIDQERARRAGVTSEQIANVLNSFLSGGSITTFRQRGLDIDIPVLIRAEARERFNLDRLRTIEIYSTKLEKGLPLLQVANFSLRFILGHIKRYDLVRTVNVEGRHPHLTARELWAKMQEAIKKIGLPPGYRVDVGGEIESSKEANAALFEFVPHFFSIMFILMVWQFNSIRKPLIIYLTIPLIVIGAAIGLLTMRGKFDFMAILGMLSLAGIIINNAIVLIDRIDLERIGGVDSYNAILNAAVKRFRPILMTTMTTILGLLPLALFGGALWFSMTMVIMFGLGVGTILTLFVVPVLYSLFFRVQVA